MRVHTLKTFLLAFVFSVFLLEACDSKNSVPKPLAFSDAKSEELDNYLSNFQKIHRLPGMATVVIKDSLMYYFTSGKSNIANGSTFNENTLFFTGSLSELMVATGILKLAELGKINLDDKVVQHLPYFKMGGKGYNKVTIKNLLTQTSGIPSHNATWDFPNFGSNALEATTKSISSQLPYFSQPGSKVKRSSYNFDILADLIEKASGEPFEIFMKQEVFNPLQMDRSTYDLKTIPKSDYALPYQIINWATYAVDTLTYYPKNREFLGSMGWHTTVKDLSKWIYSILYNFQDDDKYFLKNYNQLFLEPYYKTGPSTAIGLGWEINGNTFYKKSIIGGFASFISLLPNKKAAVAVISNVSSDVDLEQLNRSLLRWTAGEELPKLKAPVFLTLGDQFDQTHSIEAVAKAYEVIKQSKNEDFDTSLTALSALGFNLLYKLKQKHQAVLFFDFCTKEFPSSVKAKLNLAEALIADGKFEKAKIILSQVKTSGKANANSFQIKQLEELLTLSYPNKKLINHL